MADGQEPNTADAPTRGPAVSQPRGDDRANSNPRDHRSAFIQQAASDMVRHAYIACEKESGGNVGKLAEMLFTQSKVMAAASALLVDAGCIAIATGMKHKGAG